jgi:hypothetical protein
MGRSGGPACGKDSVPVVLLTCRGCALVRPCASFKAGTHTATGITPKAPLHPGCQPGDRALQRAAAAGHGAHCSSRASMAAAVRADCAQQRASAASRGMAWPQQATSCRAASLRPPQSPCCWARPAAAWRDCSAWLWRPAARRPCARPGGSAGQVARVLALCSHHHGRS